MKMWVRITNIRTGKSSEYLVHSISWKNKNIIVKTLDGMEITLDNSTYEVTLYAPD